MKGQEIFGPFFGMFLLTIVVWIVMYAQRLTYIATHKIDLSQLRTPERGAALIPEAVSYPAYNFRNLFELPVLFYALCLYLYVTENVDNVYLTCAWLFLLFRAIHSAIHCTVNVVKLRFMSYMVSAFALWIMVLRAALQLL